jgi:hypothetical protein
VNDLDLPNGPLVGTIDSLGVYQSKSINQTVIYDYSPNVVYPIKICNNATATGEASSGETVEATSNQVCIILNACCPTRSGNVGQEVTLTGKITKLFFPECFVLNVTNGVKYELYELERDENYSDAWNNVLRIQLRGTCAEIVGCAYKDMPQNCPGELSGMPVYVKSCTELPCQRL